VRALAVLLTACAGSASATRPPPAPAPAPVVAVAVADAEVEVEVDAAPAAPGAGAACARADACAADARCLAWTAGYCAAACDADRACRGAATACVATPRLGAVCARACASDADCRVDDGYVCDRSWHACLLPNTAAIEPRRCPPATELRDRGFGSASALGDGGSDGVVAGAAIRDPALAMVGSATVAIADGMTWGSAAVAVGGEPAVIGVGAATVTAWVRTGSGGAALVVTTADGVVHDDVAGDDCAGDDSCPARPRLVVAGNQLIVAYSGDLIGTRVRGAPLGGGGFGAAATALVGRRGDLAVGGDGRLHAVAMRGGTGGAYGAAQRVVEYAWSKDGGRTFAPAVRVSARDELIPAYFASPVIAVDDRHGWMYVAYVRGGGDAVWDIAVAASRDRGATWSRTTIGDGCALHAEPALAIDAATGALHVAFYDTRAAVARFAHVACAPGAQRCVERGTIGDVAFAAFDTGRLDARWIGEATALVVDDRRRVLHAAWVEPVDVEGHVRARAFTASAPL
jgi:hypothetical protein